MKRNQILKMLQHLECCTFLPICPHIYPASTLSTDIIQWSFFSTSSYPVSPWFVKRLLGFLWIANKQPVEIVEIIWDLVRRINPSWPFGTHQSMARNHKFSTGYREAFSWNSCDFPFFSHLIFVALSNIVFYLSAWRSGHSPTFPL